jgi:hypothetical protein
MTGTGSTGTQPTPPPRRSPAAVVLRIHRGGGRGPAPHDRGRPGIAALTHADYTRSRKGSHLGRRTTWISTTRSGRAAPSAHVSALHAIIADVV